ncbi:MAG: fasciclin domain-containing protein [Alphaproteobacteria bacterium]|nr:fasciclin domain-containing protein [Alphaproteobacteria bacterium]
MRRETIEEIKKFTPPVKHPSPFATPVVAMVLAGVVGITAIYADYARGSLMDELNRDDNINDFQQVVSNSTLKESFSEKNWQYTIVAPTNQAFDKAQWQTEETAIRRFGQAPFSDTPEIAPAYSGISAYDYVVSAPVYPDDIEFGKEISTPSLSGNDIVFSRIGNNDSDVLVNGQPVSSVQYADNGVIYTIDDMITFPEFQQQYSWAQ